MMVLFEPYAVRAWLASDVRQIVLSQPAVPGEGLSCDLVQASLASPYEHRE